MSWTVRGLLGAAREHLEKRGVEEARLDAELLLARALSTDRLGLYMQHDMPVADEERAVYRELLRRRAAREPLAYILGEREFYGRVFAVDRRVLVPRPETEHLVEAALEHLKAAAPDRPRIIDLGTGSGCIAITLAAEGPEGAAITAVDVSEEALEVARGNAERLLPPERRPRLLAGDLLEPLGTDERFDLIVSNPPYIGREESPSLEPEVRDHEPEGALFSEEGALAFHERIVREGRARLVPGGAILLEIGAGQGAPLERALRAASPGIAVRIAPDLAGRDRVACIRWTARDPA